MIGSCVLIGCRSEFSLTPSGDLPIPSNPYGDEVIAIPTDPRPVVRIGQADYTEAMIRSQVPDTSLFRVFADAYQGKYTDSLKALLAGWIWTVTESLGGNRAEMQQCLEATGQLRAGVISLPVIAERARYQGKEAWLFQFTWGVAPDDLGHYSCFVMNASTADTLLFIRCR